MRHQASRSGGVSVSSTTINASPTESVNSASRWGSTSSAELMIGPGKRKPVRLLGPRVSGAQRVQADPGDHSREPGLEVVDLVWPGRLSLIQASWTASSASLSEPSRLYANVRRRVRCSSKRSANSACRAISGRRSPDPPSCPGRSGGGTRGQGTRAATRPPAGSLSPIPASCDDVQDHRPVDQRQGRRTAREPARFRKAREGLDVLLEVQRRDLQP
jgi:hypothetical protein